MPRIKKDDPFEKLIVLLNGSRAASNKSYDDIAKALNMSPRSVRRYFKDPGSLPLSKLKKLARQLDIPAKEYRDAIPY